MIKIVFLLILFQFSRKCDVTLWIVSKNHFQHQKISENDIDFLTLQVKKSMPDSVAVNISETIRSSFEE